MCVRLGKHQYSLKTHPPPAVRTWHRARPCRSCFINTQDRPRPWAWEMGLSQRPCLECRRNSLCRGDEVETQGCPGLFPSGFRLQHEGSFTLKLIVLQGPRKVMSVGYGPKRLLLYQLRTESHRCRRVGDGPEQVLSLAARR